MTVMPKLLPTYPLSYLTETVASKVLWE